jgi:hypothetical protein
MRGGAKKPRRRFSSGFKIEAVKRIVEGGESVTGVARELGINRSTLGRWKRELAPVIENQSIPPRQWVPIDLEGIERAAEQLPAPDPPAPTVEPTETWAPRLDELGTSDTPEPVQTTAGASPEAATFSPEPWEQTSVRAALRGESDRRDWSNLLAESIVFQRHRISEIERVHDEGSDAGSDPSALIDDLICQAAVSLSLINDTQIAIDRMIHSSQMAAAKQLSGFRAELRQDLSGIIDRIGADAFRQAQGKAWAMCAFWRKSQPVLKTVDVREDDAPVSRPTVHRDRSPRTRRVRRRRRSVEGRDRTKPLLLGLVAAGLLWLALGVPRYERKPVPGLGLADFGHVSGIHEVTAAPPSLSVVLDADSWNGLSNSERRRLVARLGLTASAAGYQSADCTTTSGVNVAKWLRTTGVRLQDDPNATEMIAQAPPETLEERLSGRIPGRRLWTGQPTEASPAE